MLDEGLFTYLNSFDFVKEFGTLNTEGHVRHYAMCLPDRERCRHNTREQYLGVKKQHWNVEVSFRTISRNACLEPPQASVAQEQLCWNSIRGKMGVEVFVKQHMQQRRRKQKTILQTAGRGSSQSCYL